MKLSKTRNKRTVEDNLPGEFDNFPELEKTTEELPTNNNSIQVFQQTWHSLAEGITGDEEHPCATHDWPAFLLLAMDRWWTALSAWASKWPHQKKLTHNPWYQRWVLYETIMNWTASSSNQEHVNTKRETNQTKPANSENSFWFRTQKNPDLLSTSGLCLFKLTIEPIRVDLEIEPLCRS